MHTLRIRRWAITPRSGAGDKEGFDAHIDQTGIGAGGVVGVERGEDQVAGEGGVDGDLGGLLVADLADHDDVRVLAQESAERAAKVSSIFALHLDLVDAVDLVLDRVLDGHDVALGAVELVRQAE